jgi:phosphoesterase RecJ-like protein
MYSLLKQLGKKPFVLHPAPVPEQFKGLDKKHVIRLYTPSCRSRVVSADALFILDASSDDRIGALHSVSREEGLPRICIDHHPENTVEATVKRVDATACSTAQLIYELYRSYRLPVKKKVAEALYAGIHTDTVSFNFLGTNARTHEIVADLLGCGVDPKTMWKRLYGNESPGFLRLAGNSLARLKTDESGRIAWLTVRRKQLRRFRVRAGETEAFARYPLTLRGVGIVAIFCEEAVRRVRVSLRALDATDVGRIARGLGGGGHKTSAGVTLREPLAVVVPLVIRALRARRS